MTHWAVAVGSGSG